VSVRLVTFADAVANVCPGAPYYSFDMPLESTGAYRARDYVEFMAIVEGEGRRITSAADRTVLASPMRPGELYLFMPGETREVLSTSHETMHVLNCAFPAVTWHKFVDIAGLDSPWTMHPQSPVATFDAHATDVVARPFRRAAARFADGPTAMDLLEFLTSFVPIVAREQPTAAHAGGPPWLRKVLGAMLIEENLRGGVPRLTELARVNPTHLWRTVKRHTGLSPTDFVRSVQMRHAAMLIRANDDSIGSIAARCGFSSTSYFSRIFVQAHGVSPRAYRNLAGSRATSDLPPS
jgi:AraC family cel operon transcriptional repressor